MCERVEMEKEELLKECINVFRTTKVMEWYKENLEKKPQYETINSLEIAVSNGKLTVREALSIALIVGVQWNVKFEGVT